MRVAAVLPGGGIAPPSGRASLFGRPLGLRILERAASSRDTAAAAPAVSDCAATPTRQLNWAAAEQPLRAATQLGLGLLVPHVMLPPWICTALMAAGLVRLWWAVVHMVAVDAVQAIMNNKQPVRCMPLPCRSLLLSCARRRQHIQPTPLATLPPPARLQYDDMMVGLTHECDALAARSMVQGSMLLLAFVVWLALPNATRLLGSAAAVRRFLPVPAKSTPGSL